MQGHSRWTCHSEELWQNVVHYRREWQTAPVFLLRELHEQYEKAKKIWHRRRSPPGRYATGEEWRAITNSSRKNEAAGPKWKQRSVVDVPGGESKVWCCKEQYCIGTWNVRSMNQDKLEVVKQEMARVKVSILGVSILGVSELKQTGNSSDQLHGCVRFFATSWTVACQASLSIINSRSLLKLIP